MNVWKEIWDKETTYWFVCAIGSTITLMIVIVNYT